MQQSTISGGRFGDAIYHLNRNFRVIKSDYTLAANEKLSLHRLPSPTPIIFHDLRPSPFPIGNRGITKKANFLKNTHIEWKNEVNSKRLVHLERKIESIENIGW